MYQNSRFFYALYLYSSVKLSKIRTFMWNYGRYEVLYFSQKVLPFAPDQETWWRSLMKKQRLQFKKYPWILHDKNLTNAREKKIHIQIVENRYLINETGVGCLNCKV